MIRYLNGVHEEIIIPYVSPWDKKMHRYFPDFYMKVKQADGSVKRFIIEVKPKYQCKPPDANPKRKTKQWLSSVKTYGLSIKHNGNLQMTSVSK